MEHTLASSSFLQHQVLNPQGWWASWPHCHNEKRKRSHRDIHPHLCPLSINAIVILVKYLLQHTRTQKKRFPCLKFGAKQVNCLRNTGWPQALPVSLWMHVWAASAINNYCVHVNYYCLHKQLALVRIPQATKQLIVTLTSEDDIQ